jgi:membrane associated rhomboid family serine protease
VKPFRPPSAPATNSVIGLCVLVQIGLIVGGPGFDVAVIGHYGLVPARLGWALSGQDSPLAVLPTLFSHMVLHAGLIHLALNMVFLAWVGRYVEWIAGAPRLLLLFLAGGLIGGVAQVLANPGSTIPVIGASGAIASVFGAYAVMFARSRAAPRRILGITLSGETLTSLWYAASWIGLQLLVGLAFSGPRGLGIAIWTHIGGFLTGLLLARRWGRGAPLV